MLSKLARIAVPRATALVGSRFLSATVTNNAGLATRKLYEFSKTLMPKISETERVALGAGTIGFDRDIFTGSPSLQHLIDTYAKSWDSE